MPKKKDKKSKKGEEVDANPQQKIEELKSTIETLEEDAILIRDQRDQKISILQKKLEETQEKYDLLDSEHVGTKSIDKNLLQKFSIMEGAHHAEIAQLQKEKEELKLSFQKERDNFDNLFNEKSRDVLHDLENAKKRISELECSGSEIDRMRDENKKLSTQIQNFDKNLEMLRDQNDQERDNLKFYYQDKLEEQKKDAEAEFAKKKADIVRDTELAFTQKHATTFSDNSKLKYQIQMQRQKTQRLLDNQTKLSDENKTLISQFELAQEGNKQLFDKNRKLETANAILKSKIVDLEKKLALSQSNNNNTSNPNILNSNQNIIQKQLKSPREHHEDYNIDEFMNENSEYLNNVQIFSFIEEKLKEKDLEMEKIRESFQIERKKYEEEVIAFKEKRKKYETLLNDQTEISKFLTSVWSDIKFKIGPWKKLDELFHSTYPVASFNPSVASSVAVIPASLDQLPSFERDKVLKYLLKELHTKTAKNAEVVAEIADQKKLGLVLPPIRRSQEDPHGFRRRLKKFQELES